jgi:hypothetical protein
VYVVWEPILLTDVELVAARATGLVPDPRARQYWTDRLELGAAFGETISLVGEPAWDVYLLYPAGAEWSAGSPPAPSWFMHQLSGRLPAGRLLDGRVLAEHALGELHAAGQGAD